ncbi:hypothetical protein IM697_24885 [Streptomyces ferrugineus]|uniref:Uncharacterized protein n=1 Tax=Streptomyces ferrugineus TaxID=1413221 RepID=A0A7M2SAP6_9ACTN|nr:hypothetical protein [Streptomyces ferrugineus]QOV33447.1 hypothetical protein IM697_24885 [Streptomyces ferrugineus]
MRYRIVDHVLTRDPSFGHFTDIVALPEFQRWRQAQRVDRVRSVQGAERS